MATKAAPDVACEQDGYEKRGPETELSTGSSTWEQKIQQLIRENKELRSRCQFLENGQQRNKHLALEWQNFGKSTAQVLKNEVGTADKKIKFLEGRVEELKKENKELKDMCLYLDQSQGDSKLTPPELSELLVQTKFLSKLNLHGRAVSHFPGPIGGTSLKGKKKERVYSEKVSDPEVAEALTEMGKRIERLEEEKLELIKSLSAAHLLVANTQAPVAPATHMRDDTTSSIIEKPPKLSTFLHKEGQDEADGIPANSCIVSPEVIANAVTLLDMIQRLDAAEMNGFTDAMEEAEVETLRILIAVAWQKIQEMTFTDEQ